MASTPAAEKQAAEKPNPGEAALPSLNQIDPEERLQSLTNGQYEKYATQVAEAVHDVVLKGGTPTRRVADLLHGTWLGHPLHIVLTDVAIGAWLFGSLLDFTSLFRRRRSSRRAADQLILMGTLSAVPTALAGVADYSTISKSAAASAATHGLLNVSALVLYSLSLWLRKSGLRPLGVICSWLGLGVILVSGWLGGELSFRYRVGVDQAKGRSAIKRWEVAAEDRDVHEHKPLRVEVKNRPVLLYRHRNQIYAMGAVCSHAGGPLEKGCFTGAQVECPWHQSVFDLESGRVVHGPAVYAEPRYETRVRDGQVEIRSAQ